jgi:hypothetical protein
VVRVRYNVSSFSLGYVSEDARGNTDIEQFNSGLQEALNFVVMPASGLFRRGGTEFACECRASGLGQDIKNQRVKLVPFTFDIDQVYVMEFGEIGAQGYVRPVTLNGADDDNILEVPYRIEDFDKLTYFQNGNELYINSPEYPLAVIRRGSDGKFSFYVQLYDYLPQGFINKYPMWLKPSGDSNTITFSLQKSKTDDSEPEEIYAPGFYPDDFDDNEAHRLTLTYIVAGVRQVVVVKITGYEAPQGDKKFAKVNGVIDTDYTSWKPDGNTYKLPNTDAVFLWSISNNTKSRGYAQSITLFDKRLYLGGTHSYPVGTWGSNLGSGTWFNYYLGTQLPSDALQYPIDFKQSNEIKWIFGHSKLFIGSDDGIFVSGTMGLVEEAITPLNFSVRQIPSVSCSYLYPVHNTSGVFFTDRSGTRLQEIVVNETGKYMSNDLSWLGHDLTETGIVAHAWQQHPVPTYWCCCKNGQLVSFTYMPNNQITGWCRHQLGGDQANVIDVVVIPAGGSYRVVIAVTRRFGDKYKTYIEYLTNPYNFTEVGLDKYTYFDSSKRFSSADVLLDLQADKPMWIEFNPDYLTNVLDRWGRPFRFFTFRAAPEGSQDQIFQDGFWFEMLEMETYQPGLARGRIIRHITYWNQPRLSYDDDISLPVMAQEGALEPTFVMFDLSGVSRIIPREDVPDIGYPVFECDIDSINEYQPTYFGNNNFRYTYDGDLYEYLNRQLFECLKVVRPGVKGIIVREIGTGRIITEVVGNPDELKYMRVSQVISEIGSIVGGTNALFRVADQSKYEVGDKIWLDDIIDEGEAFNRRELVIERKEEDGLICWDVSRSKKISSEPDEWIQYPFVLDGGHYDSMTDGNGKLYKQFTAISLPHLEGQTIGILVNGDIGWNKTVGENGEVALDRPGYFVSAGLPYTSAVWTLPSVVHGMPVGSSVGISASYNYVILNLYCSNGGRYGSRPTDNLDKLIYGEQVAAKFNRNQNLYTGAMRIKFTYGKAKWDKEFYLETADPFPMNLLGLVHDVSFNDEEMV